MTDYIQLSYLLCSMLTFTYYNITHAFCMNIATSRILVTITPIVACHAPSPRAVWFLNIHTIQNDECSLSHHAIVLHWLTPMLSCQSSHLFSTYSFIYICGGHSFLCPSFSTKFQLQFTHHGRRAFIASASASTPRIMCYTVLWDF